MLASQQRAERARLARVAQLERARLVEAQDQLRRGALPVDPNYLADGVAIGKLEPRQEKRLKKDLANSSRLERSIATISTCKVADLSISPPRVEDFKRDYAGYINALSIYASIIAARKAATKIKPSNVKASSSGVSTDRKVKVAPTPDSKVMMGKSLREFEKFKETESEEPLDEETRQMLARLGLATLPPREPLDTLPSAEKAAVGDAKAARRKAKKARYVKARRERNAAAAITEMKTALKAVNLSTTLTRKLNKLNGPTSGWTAVTRNGKPIRFTVPSTLPKRPSTPPIAAPSASPHPATLDSPPPRRAT
jgi:hypothetical protein